MTLKECYSAMSGNYDEVLERLRNDKLISKFIIKFLSDPSYDSLCAAVSQRSASEAFRAAHTLKGVSRNLGLTALCESSGALADELRGGQVEKADELLPKVKDDYLTAVEAIKKYEANPE